MTGASKRKGLEEYPDWFTGKVSASTHGCWLWTGCQNGTGYGQIRRGGKLHRAHRWSFAFAGGEATGLDLDHLCRNRACVNPDHLEPVTRSENLKRGKGGEVSLVCRRGHWKLGDNVHINGKGHRVCLTCVRISKNRNVA